VSVRRACKVLRLDRLTFQHVSRRTDPVALKWRRKEICETRFRYGGSREGWLINVKKVYRIYREMELRLRTLLPLALTVLKAALG